MNYKNEIRNIQRILRHNAGVYNHDIPLMAKKIKSLERSNRALKLIIVSELMRRLYLTLAPNFSENRKNEEKYFIKFGETKEQIPCKMAKIA